MTTKLVTAKIQTVPSQSKKINSPWLNDELPKNAQFVDELGQLLRKEEIFHRLAPHAVNIKRKYLAAHHDIKKRITLEIKQLMVESLLLSEEDETDMF